MLQGARANTYPRTDAPARDKAHSGIALYQAAYSAKSQGLSIAQMCTRRHRGFTFAKDCIDLFLRARVQRNALGAMSRNTA
ncbi:hypothetical protein [Tardiphaga sp. 768_D3_N2_1]|uniref:hypothetical protein n=1 Tax=Tardiphaga sp. 768_D3_N2_1 TaxID=3240783 RepID=UPI003F8C1002